MAKAQTDLSPIERYGLVDDAWAAVLADRMTAVDFLAMLDGFADETDLSVWQRIVGALGSLDRLVDGDARTALQRHDRAPCCARRFERLGLEPSADDSDRDRELRGVLVGALGILGDDHAIQDGARDLLRVRRAGRRRRRGSGRPERAGRVDQRRRLGRRRGRLRRVPGQLHEAPPPRRRSCATSTRWPTSASPS